MAPANAFLDEMRIMATQEGYKVFNLGGGLGSKEDSLFDFKASFSKDRRDFRVWKYVVDDVIYASLSLKNNVKPNCEFFPRYRL
jgi:hypothetical protein